MSFRDWLHKQRHRDDPVGDLAKDVESETSGERIEYGRVRTRPRTLRGWEEHIENAGACDGAILALHRAWKEYLNGR